MAGLVATTDMDTAMAMDTVIPWKQPLMVCNWYQSRPVWTRLLKFSAVLALSSSIPVLGEVSRVETSLSVGETFTDNANATKHGQSDWITEVTPTISVHRTGGHVTGSVDASLTNAIYANDSSLSSSFVTLNGRAQVEVIDDSLFVDVNSLISRNNLSSFSGRPQWDNQNFSVQSETRYISISPRWVGHIGQGDVQFSMNYDGQALSYGSNMSNQSMVTFHGRIFNPTAGERFGWSVDYVASDNTYQNSNQQNVNDSSLTGTLTYYATPLVSLRFIVGTEKNNYMTGQDENGTVTGYGFN